MVYQAKSRGVFDIFGSTFLRQFAPLSLLVALAACGGGASQAGSPVPAVPDSTATAVAKSTPHPTTTSWNGAYTLTTSLVPSSLLDQTANSNTWLDKRLVTADPTLATRGVHTFKLADSLVAMSGISAETPGAQVAMYDIEHWTSTPLAEQQQPAASIDSASKIAHAAGKRFGIAPDGLFMGVHPGRCVGVITDGIVPKVNWSHVDVLNIQAQALASSTKSACSVQQYAAFVQTVTSYVKSKNPNIVVMAQTSLRDSTPQRVLDAAAAVHGIVSAFYVAYPATGQGYATPSNLTTVLTSLGG